MKTYSRQETIEKGKKAIKTTRIVFIVIGFVFLIATIAIAISAIKYTPESIAGTVLIILTLHCPKKPIKKSSYFFHN